MLKYMKASGGVIATLAIVAAFSYGFYGVLTYAYPLGKGDYKTAMRSSAAEKAKVLIVGARDAYDQEKFEEARKVLELALEILVDRNGHFEPANSDIVELAHFTLGKCYQREEKADKAIEEYIAALRISPDNYAAKYNLEMLQKQSKGGGGASNGDGEGKGSDAPPPADSKKPKI